jgi:Ca2+-binding EF-hand superfamily protein
MHRTALIVFGLAIAGAALPLHAQQPAGTGDKPARHAKVDANGDGFIDRNEAAAHPKLAERFDQLDRNKDGRIGPEERPQRGGKGGRGGGMAALDTNGDGAIDRNEAAKAPRMAEHFDRLDANKDGRISAEERPQRGDRQGGRHGGKGGGMAQLDRNGDGNLSREELAGRERILQQFDAIDRNRDGKLSREEMKAHHQARRAEGRPRQTP